MDQFSTESEPELSAQARDQLEKQDQRLVADFKAEKFQSEAQKHWDLFYKRNSTNFFKDRHWTSREFEDLAGKNDAETETSSLLEVGCGVGNFAFPLLQEKPDLFIFACDFSPRAVEFVKRNRNYDESRIKAFQCDISAENCFSPHYPMRVDLISAVFVLSAIKPEKFAMVFRNFNSVLKEGGKILFRDYAVNDMTMIRFAPGTKIRDKLYLRQDGTTSYFFSRAELAEMAAESGFKAERIEYVHRRTVNKKEGIDAERIFLQAVFIKLK